MDPSLYTAAMEGKLEDLKRYTDQFALQFTKNNNTVLHVVAEFGHSHCVADILSACPLLLRRENTHGDTPLHIAAAGGHDDVVQSLINFAKTPADNQNNEIAAANNGGGEGSVAPAVREMLKARNRDGDTPLHLAARYRDPRRVVKLLTEEDGWLDYRPNKAGETPLYLVVVRGSNAAVVSEILKNCKSPAYGGPGGRTAMHAAVIDSSKDAILDKLLDWKQDLIKERDTKGWTSLHFAAHYGNLEAVKKLLDKDKSVAYVTANNDEGNTALHIATATGDVLVMNEILQKFPDCWEMANSNGRTILHIAVDVERDVATNFILKKPWVSRLINRKDNDGNTPLHVLASKGKAGLHMYPGADMFALNNETMTPLDILNREESRESQVKETKDEDSSYLVQGGKPDDERIENKQSEYDLNLKGREMKQTNKDKHISKEENAKKLFTNNYNLSSLITEKDKDFQVTINDWKNGDENAMIWRSGRDHACIFLKDFHLLLREGDVGNTLIDGYTSLLEKLQKEDSNSLFFTSMCWSLIRLNNKQIGDEKSPRLTHLIDKELEQLDNKLQQKRDYFRYLVFPMDSTGKGDEDGTPYHWTLLVFDIQDKEWRHFNSKKPRDQGSQDPYMEDALIVKTYVEGYMANLHGKQEPRRTLFQDQDFNAPISSVEKAPQQSETSLDCGIIVCYIAKQFANGDEIPTSMTTDEIRAFRVELFHTFMDEIERSSSYEDWQKQRRSKEKARTRDGEENDGDITTN